MRARSAIVGRPTIALRAPIQLLPSLPFVRRPRRLEKAMPGLLCSQNCFALAVYPNRSLFTSLISPKGISYWQGDNPVGKICKVEKIVFNLLKYLLVGCVPRMIINVRKLHPTPCCSYRVAQRAITINRG